MGFEQLNADSMPQMTQILQGYSTPRVLAPLRSGKLSPLPISDKYITNKKGWGETKKPLCQAAFQLYRKNY